MKFVVYGASDDLVEVEGDIEEEFNALGKHPYLGYLNVGGKFTIDIVYDGYWKFSVSSVEGVQIPVTWRIELEPQCMQNSYSSAVHVETDENISIDFVRAE